jgi:hypothetical protein
MRVQKAENVNKALEFINSRGVKLTNIGPEGKTEVAVDLYFFEFFPCRHHRWKSETHTWHDMDAYPPFHHRGHQVQLTIIVNDLEKMLTILLVKKACPPRRVYSFGVNGKQSHMMKSMCKISPSAGLMDLLC